MILGQTIVLAVALLLVPRLRRHSAAERHHWWMAALVAAALIPPLGLSLPAWTPDWAFTAATRIPESLDAFRRWATGGSSIAVRVVGLDDSAPSWLPIIAYGWMAGAAVALLRLAFEAGRLHRMAGRSTHAGERAHAIAAVVADALGVPRPRMLLSERAAMPMTWGVRPSILLPSAARDWTDGRLRIVLTHELAHVRRGDWLAHLTAEIICACYWCQPLLWMARTRLRRESEQAADNVVLGAGASGPDYAAVLIDVVRAAKRARPRAPAVAMARESDLTERIGALLDTARNRAGATRRTLAAAMVLTVLAALPMAALGTSRVSVYAPPVAAFPAAAGEGAADATPLPSGVIAAFTPALYSDDARRLGVEGAVRVLVTLDPAGRVLRSRVVRGLGFGLDQNALVAVRQWRFEPIVSNGVAVTADRLIDVEFSRRTEALNELIANDMATLAGPGVTPPRAVRTAEPAASGRRGQVVLDVVLLETGVPKIVRILRSVDDEADEIAVRAFERWRFSPALKDGRPVKVRLTAEVTLRG
jgi:TonB family protein